MDDTLLSIIIPAYNVEKYIKTTLEMFISQNLDLCEIIVVDDGSTDDTLRVVQKVAVTDDRIKIITKENGGVSSARNLGIKSATGKFIYFMDADDAVEPGTLDFFREVLNSRPDSDMYAFGFKKIMNGIDTVYANNFSTKDLLDQEEVLKAYFTYALRIHICSCIYSKEFILKNNLSFMHGVKIDEDTVFILSALSKLSSMYISSRICYIYQVRNDSAMLGYKGYNRQRIEATKLVVETAKKLYENEEKYKKLVYFYINKRIIGHYIAYFKADVNDIIITEEFYKLLSNLKRSISTGNLKIWCALMICRFIPLKLLLRIKKG